MSIAAILPAAGSGRRFGNRNNKLIAPLAGLPLWVHAIDALRAHPDIVRIVMAIAAVDRDYFEIEHAETAASLGIEFVTGGAERTDSVRAALARIDAADCSHIAVHDAARPLVGAADLAAVFAAVKTHDAVILAAPVTSTLRRVTESGTETVPRQGVYQVQTPQVFRTGVLKTAYDQHNGEPATDDAQLVERIGVPIHIVPGRVDNLKITHLEDLELAEAILFARRHADGTKQSDR